eukprot:Pgem_evm1s4766
MYSAQKRTRFRTTDLSEYSNTGDDDDLDDFETEEEEEAKEEEYELVKGKKRKLNTIFVGTNSDQATIETQLTYEKSLGLHYVTPYKHTNQNGEHFDFIGFPEVPENLTLAKKRT